MVKKLWKVWKYLENIYDKIVVFENKGKKLSNHQTNQVFMFDTITD